LNPQCAIGADVFDTFFAAGSEYLFGIDPAQWLPLLDFAFMREPRLSFPEEWTVDDRASRAMNVALAAKVARAFGARLFDGLQAGSLRTQEQAGSLRSEAGMAVFHDTPSAAFNSSAADSRHELEMKLIERGVSFDVLHAGNIESAAAYPCVVL